MLTRNSGIANFAIFLGGIMIITVLVAPYFYVDLRVIEAFFAAGVTLVLIGILFRRLISRRPVER